MAVTSAFKRVRHGVSVPLVTEVVAGTLSGTYATGGFTWNPFAILAGPGSSPLLAPVLYEARFASPEGYIYVTSVSGQTATTKILTAEGAELANGTTVPDTSITAVLLKGR